MWKNIIFKALSSCTALHVNDRFLCCAFVTLLLHNVCAGAQKIGSKNRENHACFHLFIIMWFYLGQSVTVIITLHHKRHKKDDRSAGENMDICSSEPEA